MSNLNLYFNHCPYCSQIIEGVSKDTLHTMKEVSDGVGITGSRSVSHEEVTDWLSKAFWTIVSGPTNNKKMKSIKYNLKDDKYLIFLADKRVGIETDILNAIDFYNEV